MFHRKVLKNTSGLRSLNATELEKVYGGFGFDPEDQGPVIVVTGDRPDPWVTSINPGDLALVGMDFSDLILSTPSPFDQAFLENERNGTNNDKNESSHDCENSAVQQSITNIRAATAFDSLRDNSTRQTEYANAIAERNGVFTVGETTQGGSYSGSAQPSTNVAVPTGHSYSDIVALVHSHPPSPSAALDAQNIRPSDGDWEAADKLTGNFPGYSLPGGQAFADGTRLTLYIQDKDGNVRAFDYKTPAERGAAPGQAGNQSNASGTAVNSNSGGCNSGNS